MPQHKILPFDELTHEQFIALTIQTVEKLNWEKKYTGRNGVIALRPDNEEYPAEEFRVKIDEAANTAELSVHPLDEGNFDPGRQKNTVEEFISAFRELESLKTVEELDEIYLSVEREFNPDGAIEEQLSPMDRVKSFFSLFIPRKDYFVTPIIIAINILVFILMGVSGVDIMNPDGESLLLWGANYRPVTLDGELWRLVTCCFLHIGIFHLLMNMYALLFIGNLLERHLGSQRFLVAYLLTGITASTASLWWHDNIISAGASGAIFGLYGVFVALLTTDIVEKEERMNLLSSIGIFIVYNLANGMKDGIDNAAHIGGLVSGLVIGYAMLPSIKMPERKLLKPVTIGVMTVIVLGGSAIVAANIPNDTGRYNAIMEEFVALENEALQVYDKFGKASREELMDHLKNKGIQNWKKCIILLEEMEDLDIPHELTSKAGVLKEYCEVRIKTYELLYKAVDEDTDKYTPEIDQYNEKISGILERINTEAPPAE